MNGLASAELLNVKAFVLITESCLFQQQGAQRGLSAL